MNGEKPRQIAARILADRLRQEQYVENLLEDALARVEMSSADRGLCQELVYGVTRWQRTLDWLIARKTAGRTQKPLLRILLQLGLYQMFWLDRIPNHAAVNEMVELAKQLGLGPQAGFVNAVLRGYTREQAQTEKQLAELKTKEPALGCSHPDWLHERWVKRWGAEQTAKLLDWNNRPPPTFARLNSLKCDATRLIARWNAEGVRFTSGRWDWIEEGLVFQLEGHPSLATLGSFQEGWFYIQDPSTLLAVRELNPQPGETVLDLCAAPGGKTTLIAQRMQNRGQIIARDNQPGRLELVRENCARLGVTCVELQPAAGQNKTEQKFDRVLVDAPCSNTGVMRRRVDLRWRIRPEEIGRLRREQLDLLQKAASVVKPGGTLVYSTCSLEPEENEMVVRDFLAGEPRFKLGASRELLPFVEGVDGAFVARMVCVA